MTLPVLVVDDDPDTGAVMAKILASWGYQADVARGGHEALDLAATNRYAAAIIDYQMPRMNGVELLNRLRISHPQLPVVFVTSYATIDVVYPAIEAGVIRVLSKPANFQELMAILDKCAVEPV
jgi:two-component system, NtrC family, response regulator